jgi:hypothetical protein
MFSFLKLVDGTALIGNIIDESDQTYILEDAVELGSKNLNTLERQYFFKNVYSPFSTSSEIITELYKDHIVSIHQDIDDYVLDHWLRYVAKWKTLRGKAALGPTADDEDVNKEDVDKLKAFLEYQSLANTEIH